MANVHNPTADNPDTGAPEAARDPHVEPSVIAIGVIIGRMSEFFDFFVFGIASVLVFPEVFFPFAPKLTALLYSFTVFSFAFVARPIGSLLFRVIHKRYGRGTKLTVALFMLGSATAGIAFLPGYADIGGTAILLLAVLRIGQGLALGGSWDGLPSLLALNAPEDRRGWYAMIAQLGAPLGFMLAAGLFLYSELSLSTADFVDWGWRYPFYVAFAINVVALFARLRLVITPEFSGLLQARELEPAPLGELLSSQYSNILLGAFAPLASYALFHLVTIFPLSWVLLNTPDAMAHFLTTQIIGGAIAVLAMLAAGRVADQVGRRWVLGGCAVLIAAFSGAVPHLLGSSSSGMDAFILIGFALLGFSHSQAAGATNKRFPARFRYSGAVLTSDLSWLTGAAFAPLIALAIAAHFGVGYVSLYLLSGAIGTLVAVKLSMDMALPDD